MGAVKYDTQAKERAMTAKYPALDNALGLRILLSDYNALLIRQYQGDYDAVVLLTDLRKAIELAKLTTRQRQALELVYFEDLAPKEAGHRMKCTRQAVEQHVDKALEEIAEIYYYWNGHGEGYCVTTTKGETE